MSAECTVPPPGWYCIREPGHNGPCAAYSRRHAIEAVMDEAVEAVAKRQAGVACDCLSAGEVLEAAEPFIRKDERAKLEARLLSDEAVEAARIGSGVRGRVTAENMRSALRAALASQEVER